MAEFGVKMTVRVRRACQFVFFFQAEDGIRDLTVTGVQTCALPISPAAHRRQFPGRAHTTPETPPSAIASAGRDTSPGELVAPAGHFPERRCPQSAADRKSVV